MLQILLLAVLLKKSSLFSHVIVTLMLVRAVEIISATLLFILNA